MDFSFKNNYAAEINRALQKLKGTLRWHGSEFTDEKTSMANMCDFFSVMHQDGDRGETRAPYL